MMHVMEDTLGRMIGQDQISFVLVPKGMAAYCSFRKGEAFSIVRAQEFFASYEAALR